jgi:hypothetical protein
MLGGGLALAGYPLAYLLAHSSAEALGFLSTLVPAAFAFLYASAKWRHPAWLTAILFVLFFGLCSREALASARAGFQLHWPGYDWIPGLRSQPNLMCPFAGLVCALAWLNDVRYSTDPSPTQSRVAQV